MSYLAADITQLLQEWHHGHGDALTALLPLVYQELHRLALRHLHRERVEHTLDPAGLVNETYMRLVTLKRIDWKNRIHFFAMAARLMRQILVDHARAQRAVKRGGQLQKVTLNRAENIPAPGVEVDLLDLETALQKLAALCAEQHRIVELRYFGGLTEDEVAGLLGISASTVRRRWRSACAFLRLQLVEGGTCNAT
jgi:RNA polymerase sigma factor (TIGR02999 family)